MTSRLQNYVFKHFRSRVSWQLYTKLCFQIFKTLCSLTVQQMTCLICIQSSRWRHFRVLDVSVKLTLCEWLKIFTWYLFHSGVEYHKHFIQNVLWNYAVIFLECAIIIANAIMYSRVHCNGWMVVTVSESLTSIFIAHWYLVEILLWLLKIKCFLKFSPYTE